MADDLHREVLEGMGWTVLYQKQKNGPFHGRPPAGRRGARVMADGVTFREQAPRLDAPAFAAEVRAEMVRRGWPVRLVSYPGVRGALAITICNTAHGVVERVELDEEPDPTRRECLATFRAFVAAVKATT